MHKGPGLFGYLYRRGLLLIKVVANDYCMLPTSSSVIMDSRLIN